MTIKSKFQIWEIALLVALFFFSISLFNLAGYIYSAIIAVMLVFNVVRIKLSIPELILLFFSVSLFGFDLYHNGFNIESLILYLLGPWTAYMIGKMFVMNSKHENAFMILITVLALGMFLHGILNLYAYTKSNHFATYDNYRRSVDFWRQELVAVTVTGMYFTFAAGLSIGALFSNTRTLFKIIAGIVLAVCVAASVFFANRTLLIILILIACWKGIMLMLSRKISKRAKIISVVSVIIAIAIGIIILSSNLFGIADKIHALKIFQRITSGEESNRFMVWAYFFKDANFIRFPFGGGHILEDTPLRYLHNLWLDVYNATGVITFISLVAFSICMIFYYRYFRIAMKENKLDSEYVIFQCMIIATVLNCAVEPIVEANPYFFLIAIMYFGAMDGKTLKLTHLVDEPPVALTGNRL